MRLNLPELPFRVTKREQARLAPVIIPGVLVAAAAAVLTLGEGWTTPTAFAFSFPALFALAYALRELDRAVSETEVVVDREGVRGRRRRLWGAAEFIAPMSEYHGVLAAPRAVHGLRKGPMSAKPEWRTVAEYNRFVLLHKTDRLKDVELGEVRDSGDRRAGAEAWAGHLGVGVLRPNFDGTFAVRPPGTLDASIAELAKDGRLAFTPVRWPPPPSFGASAWKEGEDFVFEARPTRLKLAVLGSGAVLCSAGFWFESGQAILGGAGIVAFGTLAFVARARDVLRVSEAGVRLEDYGWGRLRGAREIPASKLEEVWVRDGELRLDADGMELEFAVGEARARWLRDFILTLSAGDARRP